MAEAVESTRYIVFSKNRDQVLQQYLPTTEVAVSAQSIFREPQKTFGMVASTFHFLP
jgi:hypothetical protein